MITDKLDRELSEVDYSEFSAVKKSLLEKLLQRHRQDNFKGFKSLSQELTEKQMSLEELDYVSAAGNPALNKKPEENKNN